MTFWCLFEFQEQFGSAKVDQKLWISDFLLLNHFLTARKLCVVVIRKSSLELHSASVLSACEQIFTAPSSLWNAIDTQLSVTAVWLIHNTAVVLMANKSYDLLDSSSMRFLVLTFIMQYHWLIETGGLLPSPCHAKDDFLRYLGGSSWSWTHGRSLSSHPDWCLCSKVLHPVVPYQNHNPLVV